jgi:hypothetical protein
MLFSIRDNAYSQGPPALDEVIRAFEAREQRFFENDSLMLHYERVESEDVIPFAAAGGFLLVEWRLAFRGDKWFLEQRFTEPGEREGFTVPDKAKVHVLRERRHVEWRQHADTAFVNEARHCENMFHELAYTTFLGLDVPRRIATSAEAGIEEMRKGSPDDAGQPFLPEFLVEHRDRYRVEPEPRQVDGVPCWAVVWEGMDEILVDPELGWAMRRRSYHWGPGKPKAYDLAFENFEEVQPGLWLPKTVRVARYASIVADDKSLWGKVVNKRKYQLNSAEFNKVSDELFDLKLPEGTRVVDVPRGIKYTVSPAAADPFGTPIGKAQKLLAEDRGQEPRAWSDYTILFSLGALFLALGAVFAWRRLRGR